MNKPKGKCYKLNEPGIQNEIEGGTGGPCGSKGKSSNGCVLMKEKR